MAGGWSLRQKEVDVRLSRVSRYDNVKGYLVFIQNGCV